jgi:hypothetical protein
MDKVIKHHFWGVIVVALVLPPVAWNMTVGSLNTEYEERKTALDGALNAIPKGNDAPNDDWINGAQERIDIRRTTNAHSVDRLWQTQMNLITWPGSIKAYMTNCPYPWGPNLAGEQQKPENRGALPQGTDAENRIRQVTPDLYKQEYKSELRRVWLIAQPRDDKDQRVDSSLAQKVHFPFAVLPKRGLASKTLPPTWMEIWSVQEDLWLLSQLLGAVRDVNASTTSITDSYLKRIEQLELFGGKRKLANEVAQAAATSANALPGVLGSPLGGGGTTSTSAKPRSPVFDLAEEYSAVGLAGASGQPGGGLSSAMPGTTQPAGGETKAQDPNADENRYIAKEVAYRTRGFRIKVVIHQRAVPEFIAELLGSEYPIEITRFELAALNPDTPGGQPSTSNSPLLSGGSPALGAGPALGSDLSAGAPMPTEGLEGNAFDFGEGENDTAGSSAAPVNDAAASAALNELDLMTLVVVGEMYLYNPPQKKQEEAAAGATNPGTTPATTPETMPPVTPVTPETTPPVTTPGTTPPVTTPGTTPPATTPGTTPPATKPGTTPTPNN